MRSQIFLRLLLSGCAPVVTTLRTMPASAQVDEGLFAVAAIPLHRAVNAIGDRTGAVIRGDRAAVTDQAGGSVMGAYSAEETLVQAAAGTGLTISRNDDRSVSAASDIVVTAHRDEAETSLLVRQASTSDRTGQPLRDQPRNTQVISAKLIADQQDLTIGEALRNAGDVVPIAPGRGAATFTVRGFTSEAMTNGLPGASAVGAQGGSAAAIESVERIEVLKGPVAILAGPENLGGAINIVSKKPSADTLLQLHSDVGSDRLGRLAVDANGRMTADGRLTARLIASVSAQKNPANYHQACDWMILPELRFKAAATDLLFSVQTQRQVSGVPPFTLVDPATNTMYERRRDRPWFLGDPGSTFVETRVFASGEQSIGPRLTLVARYQHQDSGVRLTSPSLSLDAKGRGRIANGESRLTGARDSVDGYARFHLSTLGARHRFVAGYTVTAGRTTSYSASNAVWAQPYAFLGTPTVLPIAPADALSLRSSSRNAAVYAQDLLEYGPLHLVTAVRRSTYHSHAVFYPSVRRTASAKTATTPSFGVIFDLSSQVSLFANGIKGFSPTTSRDFYGEELPNVESRNVEAGVKLDLFRRAMVVNASYFDIFQSNILIPDPAHRGYVVTGPGQIGRGIDVNASGTIVPGLTAQASLTRTHATFADTRYGPIVPALPKTQVSIYGAYEQRLPDATTLGLSVGAYGRSQAAVDRNGQFDVPAAIQVDANILIRRRAVNFNFGIRNLFDRRNFAPSYGATFIPYGDARNWRLSLGYHFI